MTFIMEYTKNIIDICEHSTKLEMVKEWDAK